MQGSPGAQTRRDSSTRGALAKCFLNIVANGLCSALLVLEAVRGVEGVDSLQNETSAPHLKAAELSSLPPEVRPRPQPRPSSSSTSISPERRRKVESNGADVELQSFALLPRPAVLRRGRWKAAGASSMFLERTPPASKPPSFVWEPGAHSLADPRVQAARAAFEAILGPAADLGLAPSDSEKAGLGGKDAAAEKAGDALVAVILRGDIAQARAACRAAARLLPRSGNGGGEKGEEPQVPEEARAEWHQAICRAGHLVVCAQDPEGAFRFASTLQQILHPRLRQPPEAAWLTNSSRADLSSGLPIAHDFELEDWPKHVWRGLQLDAVRHFMPVAFLKRYLRAMAFYKANVFQWHLADDQAWRVFLPSRPKLVEVSATPEYYRPEDIREVVDFAASLFVTVMPVIETPGHVLAALSAYPDLACSGDHFEVPKTRTMIYKEMLCVGKATTAQFARDIFIDLANLFPGPYIHIGGDEIETVRWESSDHVKSFAGMAGLKNLGPDILEAWYCYIGQLLRSMNRTPVMWDDHFKDRQYSVTKKCPGAENDWVVQAWKLAGQVGNEFSISDRFRFRSIATPMKNVYLDYPVASIDFNKTISWELGKGRVLGGGALMWTEDSPPEAVGGKVYPRYMGISQRLWGVADPKLSRELDLSAYEAAHSHCAADAPLLQDFNFSCGRFEMPRLGDRAPIWQGAQVSTNLDSFDKAFSYERAFDGEPETFFWAISPNAGDYLQVRWPLKTVPVGYWLRAAHCATGTPDRPGDRLEFGELRGAQWLADENGAESGDDGKYHLHWVVLANFVEGHAEASAEILEKGPISALHVVSPKRQEKWVTIPEITVVLADSKTHPQADEVVHPAEGFWRGYETHSSKVDDDGRRRRTKSSKQKSSSQPPRPQPSAPPPALEPVPMAATTLPLQPVALAPASELTPVASTALPVEAVASKASPVLADAVVAGAGDAVSLTNGTTQAPLLAAAMPSTKAAATIASETKTELANAPREAAPSNVSDVAPREAPPLVSATPPVGIGAKSGDATLPDDGTATFGNATSSASVAATPLSKAAAPAATEGGAMATAPLGDSRGTPAEVSSDRVVRSTAQSEVGAAARGESTPLTV